MLCRLQMRAQFLVEFRRALLREENPGTSKLDAATSAGNIFG
jgi:hypothetical protein